MIRKFAFDKNAKLALAVAACLLLVAVILGLAANRTDPVSGIVTIFGSLARTFKPA